MRGRRLRAWFGPRTTQVGPTVTLENLDPATETAPAEDGPEELRSAMMKAVIDGNPALVQNLLATGVSPTGDSTSNYLSLAIHSSHMAVLKELLDAGSNPSTRDSLGLTPLHVAVEMMQPAAVVALLGHGADLEAREEKSGMTALAWAMRKSNEEMVWCLLNEGAKARVVDENGMEPLHHFARAGNENLGHSHTLHQIASHLVKRGANINVPTLGEDSDRSRGATPLHYAARYADSLMVLELIRLGADVKATTAMGETVLHWAAGNDSRDTPLVLQVLVEKHGLDVNARHKFGGTPLHRAASRGVEANAQFLIYKGADRTVVVDHVSAGLDGVELDERGTPDQTAVVEGHFDVASVIVSWGR